MLRLVSIEPRVGPGPEADWPCLVLRLEADAATLAGPAPRHLLDDVARELGHSEPGLAGWAALPLPAVLARLAIAVQREVGPVLDRLELQPRDGGCRLLVGCVDPAIGVPAAAFAARWINAALAPGRPTCSIGGVTEFRRANAELVLPLETARFMGEAMRRGIPWMRLAGSCVQLGHGHRQRRVYRRYTDATSSIASRLATHKPAAAQVLGGAGLPVPPHVAVQDEAEAVAAARRIGYPVVIKPTDTDRGTGVSPNLGDETAVRRAFPLARRHGAVLVERHVPGDDHRLLVCGGRLIAAARRLPPKIVGDGSSTVAMLIDRLNADPRRGLGKLTMLEVLIVDEEVVRVLTSQGLTLLSVPEAGRPVPLRHAANLSTGGTAENVTGMVHPDNRRLAERAARILGLDLVGVDLITPDIARSHLEVGGAICDINPSPGFRPHLSSEGSPDVVRLVMEMLLPPGADGRIPIVLLAGTNGKTTTARMLGAILAAAGHVPGLATSDGTSVDGARIAAGDLAGPRGAGMLLRDPAVTAAVLETASSSIARRGLAVDACSVGAVLNVAVDPAGVEGVGSRAELAATMGRVLAVARDAVVLNADDPHCLALAGAGGARRLILVARDAANPVLIRHLAEGGLGVSLGGGGGEPRIVARASGGELLSLPVRRVPATFGGMAAFNIENAMHAAAVALGMGLPAAAIEAGLSAFRPDMAMGCGRTNLIEGWPFGILVDNAYNEPALAALGRFVSALPVRGRRLVTLIASGLRGDAEYGRLAAAAAPWFDHFICSTEVPGGRPAGDVGGRLAAGLQAAGIAPERIEVAEPHDSAFDRIMAAAQPGDLAVVLAGDPRRVVERLLREGGRDGAGLAEADPAAA